MTRGKQNQFRAGIQCSFCHWLAACILGIQELLPCLRARLGTGWGEGVTETVQEMRDGKGERLGRVDVG